MPEVSVISKNLKEIRRIMGLSQGEFAFQCGISTEILSLLEREKSDPKLSTLSKICAFAGITVSELLDTERPLQIRKTIIIGGRNDKILIPRCRNHCDG